MNEEYILKATSKSNIADIVEKILAGERLQSEDGIRLYKSQDLPAIALAADAVRDRLHGDKTYYVRLFSTPSALSTMVPGGSEDLHMAPIEPGTEQWDKRLEWLDGATLVEMNQEMAADWAKKYAERNAERLENFRSGEAEMKKIEPHFGE